MYKQFSALAYLVMQYFSYSMENCIEFIFTVLVCKQFLKRLIPHVSQESVICGLYNTFFFKLLLHSLIIKKKYTHAVTDYSELNQTLCILFFGKDFLSINKIVFARKR